MCVCNEQFRHLSLFNNRVSARGEINSAAANERLLSDNTARAQSRNTLTEGNSAEPAVQFSGGAGAFRCPAGVQVGFEPTSLSSVH